MKTPGATPHFLRVTQALAFVSGLGLPLLGCGGGVVKDTDAATDCDGECVVVTGTRAEPEASVDDVVSGVVVDAGITMGVSAEEAGPPDSAVPDTGGSFDGGPLDPPDLPA
jgi:hypothetical protein